MNVVHLSLVHTSAISTQKKETKGLSHFVISITNIPTQGCSHSVISKVTYRQTVLLSSFACADLMPFSFSFVCAHHTFGNQALA